MFTKVLFGSLKNQQIYSIPLFVQRKLVGCRPTTAMARAVLFNVLQHTFFVNISESKVLDLCCGTGIVGIEFLSQNAKHVSFVDNSVDVLNILAANIKKLNIPECLTKISKQKVPIYIPQSTFDVIFFDPPYTLMNIAVRQMELIVQNQSLTLQGIIILECDYSYKVTPPAGLNCILERNVNSKTKLLFLQYS